MPILIHDISNEYAPFKSLKCDSNVKFKGIPIISTYGTAYSKSCTVTGSNMHMKSCKVHVNSKHVNVEDFQDYFSVYTLRKKGFFNGSSEWPKVLPGTFCYLNQGKRSPNYTQL